MFSITCRWLRICRCFSVSFTCSRSSWLSCFRTSIHSWSTFSTSSRICRSFSVSFFACSWSSWSTCFSITCSRISWSFRVSCFTSRRLFSCTSGRSFRMSFRTCIHSWSTFCTSSRVSWSYGGIFTFCCTSGRSFCMSFFTSSWICRLLCMSFTSCWVIRLSFIMFRLLCFTVFICINDIFT